MTSTDLLCILFVFSIIFITCHSNTVMKSLHEIFPSSMHTIIPRGLWAFYAIFVAGPFWMNLFHFILLVQMMCMYLPVCVYVATPLCSHVFGMYYCSIDEIEVKLCQEQYLLLNYCCRYLRYTDYYLITGYSNSPGTYEPTSLLDCLKR
jgi:hypothetical protein